MGRNKCKKGSIERRYIARKKVAAQLEMTWLCEAWALAKVAFATHRLGEWEAIAHAKATYQKSMDSLTRNGIAYTHVERMTKSRNGSQLTIDGTLTMAWCHSLCNCVTTNQAYNIVTFQVLVLYIAPSISIAYFFSLLLSSIPCHASIFRD